MTWVPPTGGSPVGQTPPPAEPPAAPPPATPVSTAAPSPAPAAASPATRGLTTGVVILIAVVGGIVSGSVIGGVGTGISNANAPAYPYDPYPYDPDPVEPQDVGSPVADDPLECAAACFDLDTARLAALDDTTFAIGFLPNATDASGAIPMTADEAMGAASDAWDASGLVPDWCFPTFSELPVAETQNSELGDGAVVTLSDHKAATGSPTRLLQTVRVFDDTMSAEMYMSDLDAALSQCDLYSDSHGSTVATVTRDDALHPPDSVAALGFLRDDGVQTIEIFDIQRGNVVIRSVYTTTTTYDAGHFRPLMQQQADLLDDLVPLG